LYSFKSIFQKYLHAKQWGKRSDSWCKCIERLWCELWSGIYQFCIIDPVFLHYLVIARFGKILSKSFKVSKYDEKIYLNIVEVKFYWYHFKNIVCGYKILQKLLRFFQNITSKKFWRSHPLGQACRSDYQTLGWILQFYKIYRLWAWIEQIH